MDQRTACAARRETTRVEDVAYSLMGVFDVSLQIAYGGGDRAFCRLIEAIMRAGDPSILNWKGEPAGHPSSHAIPLSPESFVGSQYLEHKHEQLEMAMTSLESTRQARCYCFCRCSRYLPKQIPSHTPWPSRRSSSASRILDLSLCPSSSLHMLALHHPVIGETERHTRHVVGEDDRFPSLQG